MLEDRYPAVSEADELLPLSLQIVRFKVMAARRKIVRRGEHTQVSVDDLPLASAGASPLRTTEQRELLDRMVVTLRSLGPRCKELMRYKLQGRTFPEIQARMGAASINTVYTWDFRCRKELLERMGVTAEDLP